MDRSRIVTALALSFALLAVILGLVNIGLRSSGGGFVSESEAFFTSGRAGIALVELNGVIRDGYGPGGAESLVENLQQAGENPAVRAVILSVNSPGGAPAATKKIYDAVIELRKTRPVYAVITDVAASGGYYVASGADTVFAYPSSIVGSIGVISLRPNLSALLNEYGVQVEVIKSGRYKDMSYPFRSLTDEEREMYQALLDDAYQTFLNDVAEGRKKSIADVRQWAEGRIYSGEEARTLQMIDELGGREAAIAAIKLELKMEGDLPLLKPRRSFWEEFFAGAPFTQSLLARERQAHDYRAVLDLPMLYLYPAGPGLGADFAARLHGAGAGWPNN